MQPVFKLGWTLNYEMMFYLVFGLAVALPARKAVTGRQRRHAVLVALGHLAPALTVPLNLLDPAIILEFVLGCGSGWRASRAAPRHDSGSALFAIAAAWLAVVPAELSEPAGLPRCWHGACHRR